MRLQHAFMAVAIAMASAIPAAAAESNVELRSGALQVVGTLNLPDGVTRPPVVLMLHGFTGQRHEFTMEGGDLGLFSHAAARLAAAGIASLRIDFAGSGESAGKWEDTTFSGQIADAVAAVDQLQVMASVDARRVGLLGYSQGGLVGAHVAAARPEVAAVVLWAPVTNPLITYRGLLGSATVETALTAPPDEIVRADLSWGGQTALKARFFHELATTSPPAALARYSGPVAVIVGLKETIVMPQPAAGQILLDYHAGEEELIKIASDHDWDWLKSSTTVDERLLPATLSWFQQHLAP